MPAPIYTAKSTLSYPLYCADFDPYNDSFLLVGGGGGEGRSGVGNKITLLNTSRRKQISEVVDIELARDEDSVTSLAVAQSSESSAIVLAGINSSTSHQQAGKNEHLRSFKLDYPPKTNAAEEAVSNEEGKTSGYNGKTTALGRASLFNPSLVVKKETYQRVLRLSPARQERGTRLGAVATGLAPEGEVVLFNANASSPQTSDICGGIALSKGEEAADVDIIEGKGEDFQVVYCTDFEVYQYTVSTASNLNSSSKPRFLYGTPHPDAFSSGNARPIFRAIRFLTQNLLLLLQNKPGRSGAELLILDIMESGGLSNIILRKRLHRSMKAAIGLEVAILSSDSKGAKQIVVAVAGQDISIELLTLDYTPAKGLGKFRLHSVLRDIHPLQLTKLTFSTFRAPSHPVTSATMPQYLKLASVSMGNTVVVHTLPLSPFPFKSGEPRYVLITPGASEAAQLTFSVFVSIIMVALGAFLLQAFTEIRGGTPPYLGATNWLSPTVKDWIARPYMFENVTPPVITTNLPSVEQARDTVPDGANLRKKLGLRHLLKWRSSGDTTGKAIMVRDEGTDVSAEVHGDKEIVRMEAKRWEDLEEHEREGWKQKLTEVGEWAAEEGEAVLQGVFFSQIVGAVGQAVGGG
ncbi:MAG: hypothetical protein M1830_004374 [Pleopsidium flavum]|nr:MAG: hypothetical protein M1830_004374 [Pleopsidium flavum]